jgi:hypothetical protein
LSTLLFIFGFLLVIVALVLLIGAAAEESLAMLLFCVVAGGLSAFCFYAPSAIAAAQHVSGESQVSDNDVVAPPVDPPAAHPSQASQESSSKNKYPNALSDDAKRTSRLAWWNAWTQDVLNTQTAIGCKDGIQIVVFGDADTSNGYTKWANGYVRVHQDGKPYSCNESKDPAKEVSL